MAQTGELKVSQERGDVLAPFIDGNTRSSESVASVAVVNPSTGRHFLSIPAGCEADVNRAVTSAREAFADGRWHQAPPSLRKRTLHRFADLIEKHSAILNVLDAEEMGKPVREPFASAAAAAGFVRFYAEAIDKVTGNLYPSDKGSFVAERRVPRGVVAAVVPWNFPTYVATLKLAPALAAGNSVVLKPSELSSRSAIRLAHLAVEAGLPAGVFNVVLGLGETVGRALGMHMDVDMLSFTGSTAVGKQMLIYAGQSNMKVVMVECGGKSPHILFDDGVELQSACDSIASMILVNQGQLCSVGSRLLVQESIQGEVVERIAAGLRRIVMGNAADPSTTFGPLASAQQCDRVVQYIEAAAADGAQLVTGGKRARPETGGYFVEPTLLRNVEPASKIAQEEVFGPVLALTPFKDEPAATALANRTIYGLAAYVWTSDLSRAMRVAKGVRSSVWVNAAVSRGEGAGYAASYEPTAQSGFGTEGGIAGLESYLRRQLVWISHS